MLAARILGWKGIGLASILKQEYGIQADKRFQRANWGRRPLTSEQIAYARQDTYYLIDLRGRLEQELVAAGRLAEAKESFAQIVTVTPSRRTFKPDDFWQLLNGRYQFTPQQHAVLRELYIFRERESQRRDRPPLKVFNNRTLLELAEALPHYVDEFQGIHGLTPRVVSRYGRRLIQIIIKGLRAQPPELPSPQIRPSNTVLARFEVLRTWRKKRAAHRGVESGVIISKKALWELANRDPKTDDELAEIKALGPWQRNKYGQEVLEILRQCRRRK